MRGGKLLVFLLFINFCAGQVSVCSSNSYTLDATKTDANPLRGFLSYIPETGNRFPSSLEYDYICLKDVMTGTNTFNWNPVENMLNDVASRNKQTVFRFYLDYPDNPPSCVPNFLLASGGCVSNCVTLTSYTEQGGGQSPDYTNANLVSALERFIAALGQKYDGDPRIGFIKVGLLGFWGEWHTYPRTALMDPSATAVRSTMSRVLTAYNNSFAVTQLAVSADEIDYDIPGNYRIGWHDDDFGASTCTQDYGFKARMADRPGTLAKSNTVAFGGEVQPTVQNTVFSTDAQANTIAQCIADVRPSWLLYYDLFQSTFSATPRARALTKVRQMGYQFVISKVEVGQTSCAAGSCVAANVFIRNNGNAPFYYDAFIAVTYGSTEYVSTANLKGLLPSQTFTSYTIVLRPFVSGITKGTVRIKSAFVPAKRPIVWAASTANVTDGSVAFDIPSSCGSVTVTNQPQTTLTNGGTNGGSNGGTNNGGTSESLSGNTSSQEETKDITSVATVTILSFIYVAVMAIIVM